MYTNNLLDHFTNPRNAGIISDANGIGTIGDPDCGDFIRIYIRVRNDRLKDVSFEVCGCPAAIATTSILTELAKGKTINEAMAIDENDVLKAIGELPQPKVHCSNLGPAALKQAILYYLQNK
jgi:nitrogen fixation protein NifU and related proteins